jgi:hypothetical protein
LGEKEIFIFRKENEMSKWEDSARSMHEAGMNRSSKPKKNTMQYMLIFRENEADFALREDPAKQGEYWGAWTAYCNAMVESGVIVSGAGLMPPSTATTVRVRDNQRIVQDGPYAESKEMLGGFFVIEVPDLDAALEWAARSPSSGYASTEVRPVLPPPVPA